MPSVADKQVTLESLVAKLSLTSPCPNPKTHSDLLSVADLHREEDLLRNPSSFQAWWTAITNTREAAAARQKLERDDSPDPSDPPAVMGPLATPVARAYLQRLTYIYEAALAQFPGSFKLWKSYLLVRMSYVMGRQLVKKKAGGAKKLPDMKDALEEARADAQQWEGGLDPVAGWEEWKSLVAVFERALMWLPKLPRLWLLYLSVFDHPLCPPLLSYTHARRTYDRALRTLPPSLHARIWVRYLLHAEARGGLALVSAYRRYLSVDASLTEHYTTLLLNPADEKEKRPLEAAKLLLGLARGAARGEYVSAEGKSAYQLLGAFLDVVEASAEDVGLDVDETDASNKLLAAAESSKNATADVEAPTDEPASVNGQLIRFAGAPVSVGPEYDADEDPLSPRKLNIEHIVMHDGLRVYADQAGRLWTGLAAYWLKRGDFARATDTFERGLGSVLTVRDFTVVFEAYSEFCESLISALMESLEEEDDEEEDEAEDKEETQRELDEKMAQFEALMDRRPFLLNDVLIRRNPHDVQEWEKRVALHGSSADSDAEVAATYAKALETINPRKATANLHRLYINYAKFYEEGGVSGEAEPDLDAARKVLEKGTKVNFRAVEDLAEVWCEWAEMEIRQENYDEALRVMQRAAAIPKNTKISYHDHTLPAQVRLFKSLKLWSFYVDLEESLGSVDSAKRVYDQILELRIANAQVIVNYAAFLEENKYWEDAFRVYERGVELFTFPVSFEIWNIYLGKFVKRYGGAKLERARDLFEQALEKCPAKSCKPLFLMYAQLEEEHGLAKRAMAIYDRATQVVADEAKFEMFTIYIAKATANYGLPATRPIYERALEVLPDRQTAEMCLRFAALERKLGEIDRARAVYAHASQFCDPRTHAAFWAEWNAFEIETGSEDTFREMLRIKRSVQAQFNTEASYLAAQTTAAREGAALEEEDAAAAAADPMAGLERAAGPAFVAAKHGPGAAQTTEAQPVSQANDEEIHISDDEE
ncbi:hypothetical protein HWV62_9944 [Athelia sp. TMB]|nr:hypothetical protein HWV62_9944 [Athelia sp. TMB]